MFRDSGQLDQILVCDITKEQFPPLLFDPPTRCSLFGRAGLCVPRM